MKKKWYQYGFPMLAAAVLLVVALVGLPAPRALAATLATPTVISSNMVLQRGMTVPIWGTGTAGATVTVSFNGQNVATTVGSDGKWRVNLASMTATSSPLTMTITSSDSQSLTYSNIQVGEVWLGSGQSNMDFGLNASVGGAEAVADSANYNIAWYDQRNPSAGWVTINPSTAGGMSAIGFYSSREYAQHELAGIPIGFVQSALGGSKIETWTTNCSGCGGSNYFSLIVPIQPYALRGAYWYQGEGNTSQSDTYTAMLRGLMSQWRNEWGQGNFPFYIVQLPWSPSPHREGWAGLQEDERLVAFTDPNSGLAVSDDLPGGELHPPQKLEVGVRLALNGRAKVYGNTSLVYSGPAPSAALSYVQGNQVVIGFDFAAGGMHTSDGLAPAPFKVAGSDGVYHDATAQIVGTTVVVSSASEPNPVRVRYIWNYDHGNNLFNTSNLPAPVFELDLSSGGPTATPVPPTNTPTKTATPTITNTPTKTATPTITSTPSANLPDLTGQAVRISSRSGLSCSDPDYNTLGTYINVTNNGPVAAGNFEVDVNGVRVPVAGLAAQTTTGIWVQSSAGTATVTVDVTEVVVESNESNNVSTVQLPIPTPQPGCTPTATPGGSASLFFDGFEDGSMSDWSPTNNAQIKTSPVYAGAYSAGAKLTGVFYRTISTAGYANIHVKYAGRTSNLDAGEYLKVEWYDGSAWTVLDQLLSESGWTVRDWTMPAGAANNASFALRFSTNANGNTEWVYVDSIEVTSQ